MVENTELDLTQIEWPLCLLEFTRVLDATTAGCEIKVLIADRDVMQNVQTITVNSRNRIVAVEKEKDRFIVWILKC